MTPALQQLFRSAAKTAVVLTAAPRQQSGQIGGEGGSGEETRAEPTAEDVRREVGKRRFEAGIVDGVLVVLLQGLGPLQQQQL